jgi:hypothetical protein
MRSFPPPHKVQKICATEMSKEIGAVNGNTPISPS